MKIENYHMKFYTRCNRPLWIFGVLLTATVVVYRNIGESDANLSDLSSAPTLLTSVPEIRSSHPEFKFKIREKNPLSNDISLASTSATGKISEQHPETEHSKESAHSEAVAAFHAGRDSLMRDHQQLMRQLDHASAEERQQAMKNWREANAESIKAQQHLAREIGQESRSSRIPISLEPRIPSNATPELREMLTARHAVMKGQVEMMNQLSNASPEERNEAMQKWRIENASRLDAMRRATTQFSQSQSYQQH